MMKPQDSSTKTTIQTELEDTRAAFHDLLDGVSDEEWNCRSGNAAWTIGTELWHIADSLRFIHGTIKRARRNRHSLPIKLPARIVDLPRMLYVKWFGRNATRQAAAEIYDAGHARFLDTLALVRDDEWNKSSVLLDWHLTIIELFHRPAAHFAEHAASIQNGLAAVRTNMDSDKQ